MVCQQWATIQVVVWQSLVGSIGTLNMQQQDVLHPYLTVSSRSHPWHAAVF